MIFSLFALADDVVIIFSASSIGSVLESDPSQLGDTVKCLLEVFTFRVAVVLV